MTDQKTEFSFAADTNKLLKLMIHSLYSDRDIFMRELIANATDAIEKRNYLALSDEALAITNPSIHIRIREDENIVSVTDHGIGMDRAELIEQLGTIALSNAERFAASVKVEEGKTAPNQIGQFGVGFYSVFMIAQRVIVDSRKAGTDSTHRWVSEGEGNFTVTESEEPLEHPGTRIRLELREDASEYKDQHRITHLVQSYANYLPYPIYLKLDEEEEKRLNTGEALWRQPSSNVSKEQYQQFYEQVAHLRDEPLITIHTQAEGAVSYRCLLFIPSSKPFDLFHPDRQRRVKLYIKNVFIAEDGLDIIPRYLRFAQGVVESDDLPLNISRDTLQYNSKLERINRVLTKKILRELEKLQQKQPEQYDENFWPVFGPVLKEGLCESIAPREAILDACRFYSSRDEKLTGLKDYVERMAEGQEEIYYLVGDSLSALREHPQLEALQAKGIEILLLNDSVDDFWLNVVQDYKGKPLRSITKENDKLQDLLTGSEKDAEEAAKDKPDAKQEEMLKALKEYYGDEVREVRFSQKLVSSPACLALGEGDMDIRFEQFLRAQKQLPDMAYPKILEINPKHPIVAYLTKSDPKQDIWKDAASFLLDQARLVEGEKLPNPTAFTQRLNRLVEKALAA